MKLTSFHEVLALHFQYDLQACADFLHVNVKTIRRWLSGESAINPAAEKLLYIVARGYLPPDIRFHDYRIDVTKTAIITPMGREIGIIELDHLALMKDEYHALVDRHGRILNPPKVEAKVRPNPFRGNRRSKAVHWIPSRDTSLNRPQFKCD
ncbi:S-adenosylhomocysteine hydrolase [Vibrio jasicida]|uniref:S-adenosylhomocysteine hydrolase n=1 Tax=Vibrio jasicida TaxID=766224 RepID=UPI000CE30020|nr:S-adenosylhomocysteine hydrolase [Vibrio jasicida]